MIAYSRGSNLRDVLVNRKANKVMFGKKSRGREDCSGNCVVCQRTYVGDGKDEEKIMGPQGVYTFDRTIGCRSRSIIYGK